ncbi:MAG: hypothetical protein OXF26_12595 [Alphaproteobacteria bacterium]|nr:hypothetical protein [Alphaproteobacteria bacterium]MCY4231685.1 hypothetical protein [Alphaproteobacteria bacterium]MCY4318020.1 hypothetical protein [Alphaproteobacteria bacterium]
MKPLSLVGGVEIRGIDLAAPFGDETFDAIMDAFLDSPVGASEGHEAYGLFGRQTCDEVGDLDTLASPDFPPGNLRQSR